eukprot:CAMPEP_0173173454 /NCGR_PEP_ID=MMETSP1141-20130122/2839_1 /TAXON_ID=483371 /ORGANISM="non described non described, Strain CCMP2298" /LENGTH=88 /DNA_ID=CAMNT_0014095535 /DNA_START=22 /DNA_END=288 /DNA_ORIENTATION=+
MMRRVSNNARVMKRMAVPRRPFSQNEFGDQRNMWTKVTDTVFSPAGMACIGFAAFTSWVFRDQIAQIYPAIGTYQITGTIAPKGKDTK